MAITYKIVDQYTDDFTDLDKVCELMTKVNNANEAPYLYPPDESFFKKTCKKPFLTIIAFDENKVVGYRVVKFLDRWPRHLSNLEGFAVEDSVVFWFVVVDPEYRGQNIGHTMNQIAIKEIKKTSRENIFLTVHPDNIANIKNAEKVGFSTLGSHNVFSEKITRNLMHKKI